MPTVITEIVNLVNDGFSSLNDVARIVQQDQTLASKVLSLVNSASFGITYKVTSVGEAVNLLGLNRVTAFAMDSLLLNPEQIKSFDLAKFWQHTIATSIAARHFAEATNTHGASELSSTVGLLHDIGKLYFIIHQPEEYLAVQKEIKRTGKVSQLVERNILGVDHCQAGLLLTRQWNWPKTFQELIFHHHYPFNSEMPKVSYFVYLANYVSHFVMKDLYPDNISLEKISTPIVKRCPGLPTITLELWDDVRALVEKELNMMSSAFGAFST